MAIKRATGGQGSHVYIVHVVNGELTVNGGKISVEELVDTISTDHYLITDLVESAEYASSIFPDSVNTIRLTTLIDSETGEPFIASAVHRFGTVASAPTDNWSAGGACAGIDTETGELVSAVAFPSKGEMEAIERHPDTNEQIVGVEIPDWKVIRNQTIELADYCRVTPYIAWDFVFTDDGLQILEANDRPDPNLIQLHEGLFTDSRVKRSLYDHL
jgi:hypothetical protein